MRYLTLALLLVAGCATADRFDRRVTFHNNTGVILMMLYGSNVGTDDWQEDILGDDAIMPGESARVNFYDGTGYCLFDLKLIFADFDVLYKHDVNVCEITDMNIGVR